MSDNAQVNNSLVKNRQYKAYLDGSIVRLTIDIPKELHTLLKTLSVLRSQSMRSIIVELIDYRLKEMKEDIFCR